MVPDLGAINYTVQIENWDGQFSSKQVYWHTLMEEEFFLYLNWFLVPNNI